VYKTSQIAMDEQELLDQFFKAEIV